MSIAFYSTDYIRNHLKKGSIVYPYFYFREPGGTLAVHLAPCWGYFRDSTTKTVEGPTSFSKEVGAISYKHNRLRFFMEENPLKSRQFKMTTEHEIPFATWFGLIIEDCCSETLTRGNPMGLFLGESLILTHDSRRKQPTKLHKILSLSGTVIWI